MHGEYKKAESSATIGDSGESQTQSLKNVKYLQPKDMTQQPTGHWTDFVANATPPFFHAQFDKFKIEPMEIPKFSGDLKHADSRNNRSDMELLVKKNFSKVKREIQELLDPYMPVDLGE